MRTVLFLLFVISPAVRAQGSDAARIAEVRAFVERQAAADSFSGVVLIAYRGTPVLQVAVGQANRSSRTANRIDTKFYLASMTKMFTGVAIGRLAQEGRLQFSDVISKYVPEVPKEWGDRITIQHLLTHTSGLGTIWKPEFQRGNRTRYRNTRDFFPLFINDPPAFVPGAKWAYSNAGYVLLGAVIERVTGNSYREYVREAVFRKADMPSAMADDVDAVVPNRALPYTRSGATRVSAELMGLANMMPAGGAVASAPDLLRFANALSEHRLLNIAYTDTVTRGKVTYRPGASYGYGFANEIVNGIRIIFHDGGADGISTNLDLIPELGITAIVLSNYDPPSGRRVANYIREVVTRR